MTLDTLLKLMSEVLHNLLKYSTINRYPYRKMSGGVKFNEHGGQEALPNDKN
jgi:hypothetical protein